MSWLRQPMGQAARSWRWSRASTSSGRCCRSLIAIAVRVQQGALADDLAGLLVPLVHRRVGQRVPRSGPAGRAQAHAVPGGDLRSRRDAARRLARTRAAALAGPRQRHRQHGDAAAARDARDRDGRGAAAPLPARVPADRARHDGAGDRPGHVHPLVRGRDRARAARRRSAPSTRRRRPTSVRRRATSSSACCCRCSRLPSSPAPRSPSPSRSTTSSSRSTCRATPARRPSRCCCTRPPAARRLRP